MKPAQTKILQFVIRRGSASSPQIAQSLGVSRQYAARILAQLVKQGKLIKVGTTNRTVYNLPQAAKQSPEIFKPLRVSFSNSDLKEHEVLRQIELKFPPIQFLQDNVKSIFDYAFSEMLNNAIEHSQSQRITVEAYLENKYMVFRVEDYGIGVFYNVMHKKRLKAEVEAIQDLLKGKTTTQPQAHSGEGIFFTSKSADVFLLDSHQLRLQLDNESEDVSIEDLSRRQQGTRVTFKISRRSKRHLIQVFNKFTNSDSQSEYGFDQTEIKVKLFALGGVHVSRSQARRIVEGLDKFKSIIFDFDQVPMIGQAFADEIFRVFHRRHPKIRLQSIHMNEAVEFMVKRVST